MSAFVPANLPSNVNTVERLLVWAAQALTTAANGATISAVQGNGPTPTVQVQLGTTADNVSRFVITAYVPVSLVDLNNPSQKTWMAAQDVTTTAINSVYTTN